MYILCFVNIFNYFTASSNNLDEIEENWKEVAKYMLFFEDAAPESIIADISQKIKDFYFPSGKKIDQSNFQIFTKVFFSYICVSKLII